MGRFLIVTVTGSGESHEAESNTSLYLEKASSAVQNNSHSGDFLFKSIITDSKLCKVKKIFPENGWALLADYKQIWITPACDENGQETAFERDLLLADCLHEVADSLPYTGAILRVSLFDNCTDIKEDEQCDHFIPVAGALRRLREWHNGQILLVNNTEKLPSSREPLVDLGHCEVVDNVEQLKLSIPSWEGKIAVVDRIESKGPTFTGCCLNSDVWEKLLSEKVQTCMTYVHKSKGIGKRCKPDPVQLQSTRPVCGRTMEILQEVDLRTFPYFLSDCWSLSLNVHEGHPDVLMKYIQELEQVGLLARLRVYSDGRYIPCCGRTNSLNTEAWKKRILGNSCEEPPEKSVANSVIFIYLLLLPPIDRALSSSVAVQVLLSPQEINQNVIELMTKQSIPESYGPQIDQAHLNSDLRVLQSEGFQNLQKLLQEHNETTAKSLENTQELGESDVEKMRQDIMEIASEMQDKIVSSAFKNQRTLMEYMQEGSHYQTIPLQWIAESSLEPAKFPEKMALQAKYAKSIAFQSYPSTDSLLNYSPISLEEMEKKRYTTDFDVDDILRMFNKDGSPVAPPFTPEKVVGRNLCRVDSTPDLNTQWPNSQSIQYHDIYYYMDENDLGLEKKYSKIRDKVLEQDTLCTFVSPVKKRTQKLQRMSPIRSSPRRRNSAQHLMTRNRSDSFQSSSSQLPPHQLMAQDVFKQPRPSLHSPSPRLLSTSLNASGSIPSASQLHSGNRTAASSTSHFMSQPVSHSTPLSSLPRRVSPHKKLLSRSHSLTGVQTLPAVTSKNNRLNFNPKKEHEPLVSQRSQQLSTSEASRRQSFHAMSSISDPPVRKSPRKTAIKALDSSKHENQMSWQRTSDSSLSNVSKSCSSERTGLSRTSSALDLDETSQQSQSGLQQPKMKRSDRHKLKLKSIIKNVLEEKGVT
ncbi:hypothetical protein EGW08_005386, partial [Elysia chlorotica]